MPFDKKSLIHEIYRQASLQGISPPLVTRLVKLLYLSDLEWRRHYKGEAISDLTWKFLHFGPYATELGDLLGGPNAEIEELKDGREVKRISFDERDLKQSKVPQAVQYLLGHLVAKWGAVDLNVLLDHVYFDTEPMQNARRGEMLDFTKLSPPEPEFKPKFDQQKLKALREKLRSQINALNLKRDGIHIPSVDLESERAWDEEDRPIPLPPGTSVGFEE